MRTRAIAILPSTAATGILGALLILAGLTLTSLKVSLLGLLLCLAAAFAQGWLDHSRHQRAIALRSRLRARRNGPQNWRG